MIDVSTKKFLVGWLVAAAAVVAAGAAMAAVRWQWTQDQALKNTAISMPVESLGIAQPQPASRIASELADNPDATRMWFGFTVLPNLPLAAPRSAPNWRVAGTTDVGGVAGLLVLFEGSKDPVVVAVGQTLPGGATLVALRADKAQLRLNGRLVELALFN